MSIAARRLPPYLPLSPIALSLGILTLVVLAGSAVVAAPTAALASGVALVLTVWAFIHPPVGAYVLVTTTPLIAGINRGDLFPVLRPHEAVALLIGAALVARGLVGMANGTPPRFRVRTTDASLLLLVCAGSLMPLLWLLVRGKPVASDDLLYALALVKYYGLYLIIRTSIRTDDEVRRCLWLSMGAGSVVAIVAILQSLNLFGVPGLLAAHYASYGDTAALSINRGSSTLSHPHATAVLLVCNLAIAAGWLASGRGSRRLLVPAAVLFVFGTLASGEFSGALALVVGVVAVGIITRKLDRALLALVPTALLAGIALRPVINRRLSGFSSGGVPDSWTGRLDNLRTFFWPQLTRDFHWVLGVRPSARLPLGGKFHQYVFIENGHTWLLWTGGIPLFAAFVVFLWTNIRTSARIARRRDGAIRVAGIASFTSLVVLAIMTTFDPHLTLRGSADLNFSLLALAHTALRRPLEPGGRSSQDPQVPSQARQQGNLAMSRSG